MSRKEVFTDIFKNRRWGNEETVSGGGSMLSSSKMIQSYLPHLIEIYGINSICDLACGDFNWMKKVDLSKVQYLGLDIVDELIERNSNKFAKDNIRFATLDATRKPPTKADLVIVRDVMVHQSFEDNLRIIENIRQSYSKYVLATTFPDITKNEACMTGNWKAINLEAAPYNFPPPLIIMNEMPYSKYKNKGEKFIGLWEVASIQNSGD